MSSINERKKPIDRQLFMDMAKAGYAFGSICRFFGYNAKETSLFVRRTWDCTFKELQSRLRGIKSHPQGGRPKIEIDSHLFEHYCGMWCTLAEISNLFGCSDDTIENWCHEFYGIGFQEAYKRFSAKGNAALRQAQMKNALGGGTTMQIWLGKQALGQRDEPGEEPDHGAFPALVEAIERMKERQENG